MNQHRESGFILYECLISVLILSLVLTTLLQVLPNIFLTKTTLNHEQLIFNQVYQLKDQLLFQQTLVQESMQFISPIPYQIIISDTQVCAHYTIGVSNEKTICL